MYTEDYIANRINELCEKQNISKYQLAKQSGMSESSISNLVNRKSDPQCTTIHRICKGLGITMSQFFSITEEKCDLSPEQIYFLELWESLSREQKQLVEAYIAGIKSK